MSLDKEKDCGCNSSTNEQKCCGDDNKQKGDESCCGGDHNHDEGGCCGGGHEHNDDHACGCGGDHEHHHHQQSITLTLEDDTELDCPIVDAFEINEQSYIALLHPIDETVLLYKFFENDDDTIDLASIDDDTEFDLVSKTFLSLQEQD